MNSQLYTAASGLLVEERRIELIANNLANLSTPGYRSQRAFSAVYQRFAPGAPDAMRVANASVALAGAYEVPGTGPLRQTGRDTDCALENGTFLVVQTPAGRRYTRAGNLEVTPAGTLADAAGNPVLGTDGRPLGGLGPGAAIQADGRIVEGETDRGRILIVRDPNGVLRREGSNLLTAEGKDAQIENVGDPALRPGWLEASGVDPVGELVRLIEAQRAFESYQRLISTTMNDVNKAAATQIAG